MTEATTSERADSGKAGVQPARRRFSVEEYCRMANAGILGPDERVELIDGEIYRMAAIGSRHAACVSTLDESFATRIAGRAIVRILSPVRLSSGSEPEPDLVRVRPRPDRYARAHPGPEDVLLLIEVSDTSLAYDLELKLPRYAEAGIPEVWVVDLGSEHVLTHAEPREGHYQRTAVPGREGTISPSAFPDLVLRVDDFLL